MTWLAVAWYYQMDRSPLQYLGQSAVLFLVSHTSSIAQWAVGTTQEQTITMEKVQATPTVQLGTPCICPTCLTGCQPATHRAHTQVTTPPRRQHGKGIPCECYLGHGLKCTNDPPGMEEARWVSCRDHSMVKAGDMFHQWEARCSGHKVVVSDIFQHQDGSPCICADCLQQHQPVTPDTVVATWQCICPTCLHQVSHHQPVVKAAEGNIGIEGSKYHCDTPITAEPLPNAASTSNGWQYDICPQVAAVTWGAAMGWHHANT
jgi:hypothetical protein